MYTVQKETEGRFTFISHESGVYRFCFSNAMSTVFFCFPPIFHLYFTYVFHARIHTYLFAYVRTYIHTYTNLHHHVFATYMSVLQKSLSPSLLPSLSLSLSHTHTHTLSLSLSLSLSPHTHHTNSTHTHTTRTGEMKMDTCLATSTIGVGGLSPGLRDVEYVLKGPLNERGRAVYGRGLPLDFVLGPGSPEV